MRNFRKLKVRFENAGGLEPGDKVTVYGIEKGKVKDLTVSSKGVISTLLISKDIDLKEDAEFSIHETDFMGHKALEIYPGDSANSLSHDQIHSGTVKGGLSQLVAKVSKLSDKVDKLLNEINENNTLEKINNTINSTNQLIDNSNKIVLENKKQIKSIIKEAAETIHLLKNTTKRTGNQIDPIITKTDSLITDLEVSIHKFNEISEKTNRFVDTVNENEGTIQLLLKKDELYKKILTSTTKLDSLLSDIKENPKKYLKLEIF